MNINVVKNIYGRIYDVMYKIYIETTDNIARKAFIVGIIIYIVALYALMRGDVYYADDWHRSIASIGWDHISRPVATYVFRIASVLKSFVDISPIPQIIAIVMLSLSGVILSRVLLGRYSILGVIASVPLGLNPYYLENLSYRFDALTMSFSVLCAVLPFLCKKPIYFTISSIICLVLMYASYQASSGIYILIAIYLCVKRYCIDAESFKKSAIFLLSCMVSFVIASLFYEMNLIATDVIHASTSILSLDDLLVGGGQ